MLKEIFSLCAFLIFKTEHRNFSLLELVIHFVRSSSDFDSPDSRISSDLSFALRMRPRRLFPSDTSDPVPSSEHLAQIFGGNSKKYAEPKG
jgi:hypothetical protein